MVTLGTLQYLITAKDATAAGISSSEKRMKQAGNAISAMTIAKGKLIGDFAKQAVKTVANTTKQLVKTAVMSYADFEQLEGGVKKLFGPEAQRQVMKYAQSAYKTAGLSANEYMQTVTDFSAALINSLGGDTAQAADVADMAIRDMADNVNTFGSSMESVQNAYKGFSKQNYTMLDNLKLGYGGTRKEMERLLKDAEAFEKTQGKIVKYDINNLADVYKAINAIQRKNNITGTTKDEAERTISGSIASAKSAWQNMLTSFGDGDNVRWTTRRFASTLKRVVTNIKPVAINAFKGLLEGAKGLLPVVGGIAKDLLGEAGKALQDAIARMKKSDSPVLQKLGSALEFVSNVGNEVIGLFTDFPAKIAEWKTSESPGLNALADIFSGIKTAVDAIIIAFNEGLPAAIQHLNEVDTPLSNLAAGSLQTIYDICNFFTTHVGLEGTIRGVATAFLAFKGIKIGSSLLRFVSMLNTLKGGGLKAVADAAGGAKAAGAGAAGAKAAGGGWLSRKVSAMAGAARTGLSLFGAGSTAGLMGLFAANGALGYAGAKMIQANLDDPNLQAVYGTGNNNSIVDTMSTEAAAAAKQYWQVYEDTGSEAAMNARDKLFGILTGEGYVNAEQGVSLIEQAFDNLLNGNDADGLGERLQQRFNEIGDVEIPVAPTVPDGTAKTISDDIGTVHVNGVLDLARTAFGGVEDDEHDTSMYADTPTVYSDAKGSWDVPFDSLHKLHRDEMILNATQARQYREGNNGNGDIIAALQGLRNDLQNLKLVVGSKTFGRAVVDYGGNGMSGYIGGSESRLAAGYGT